MRTTMFTLVTCVLFSLYCTTYGDEQGYTLPAYEYSQIFKSVPAVLEYLLNALEERPEILERDDITKYIVTNSDDARTSKKTRHKRAYNINDKQIKPNNPVLTQNERHLDRVDNSPKSSTVSYDYYRNNNILVMKIKNEFNEDEQLSNIDNNEEVQIKNANTNKAHIAEDSETLLEDHTIDGAANPEVFLGSPYLGDINLLHLDYEPNDVVERIMLMEELLEEYNSKKDKQEF